MTKAVTAKHTGNSGEAFLRMCVPHAINFISNFYPLNWAQKSVDKQSSYYRTGAINQSQRFQLVSKVIEAGQLQALLDEANCFVPFQSGFAPR